MEIVIGMDAGGTRTTLVAVDSGGGVLAWGQAESINTNTLDAALCHARLEKAVSELADRTGADAYHLSVGSCTLDGEADGPRLTALFGGGLAARTVYANTDAFMTLIATTGGAPGCVLISGTGCIGLAMNAAGETLPVAGYGWRITEDEGSGYHVAMEAITRVIHAQEGRAPGTMLTARLLERYGLKNVRDLIGAVYDDGLTVGEIAQFARDVFFCAQRGDAAARQVLGHAMEVWQGLAEALCRFAGPDSGCFGLYGGMFQHHPELVDRLARRLRERYPGYTVGLPSLHPALGAALYWFIRNGKDAAGVRRQMLRRQNESEC